MWLLRRILSLNWLYAVLAQLYPPLRTVPLGALGAVALLVSGFWLLSHYVLGHAPASLSIRTLPAILIRKPPPGPGRIPLDFLLTERDGAVRPVASLLGKGRTLMYLYSPYCGNCTTMLPGFSEFTKRLEPGVEIVGVQYQGTATMVASLSGMPGRLVADPKGEF